jgi:hypothetical protein
MVEMDDDGDWLVATDADLNTAFDQDMADQYFGLTEPEKKRRSVKAFQILI